MPTGHLPHRIPRQVALLLLLSTAQATQAQDVPDSELQDLLSLLDQQTQLATKSRMNADYVPGMTSVLDGEELLARGARTVWEALGLVPGISLGMEFTGEKQVLSRGVGHGYASGNIKILLDGVSMNSTLLATANPVLNIPIQQVERIEVMRGPGSSVYGEYAYAGVVNVITRRTQRRAYANLQEDAYCGAGGQWSWSDPRQALSVSLNLAGRQGDGQAVEVAQDALFQTGQQALSNAPGPTNEAQDYRSLFLDLRWGRFFAAIKLLDDAYGDHFGINHFLPPPDHRLASRHIYHGFNAGGTLQLARTLEADLRLELLRHERNRQHLFIYPADYLIAQPIFMDSAYTERKYLVGADLHWRPDQQHQILFTLEASDIHIENASWRWPELPFELPPNWINTGMARRVLSLVAQDEYRLNESITLTITLRHDDYSDVGSNTSPRLAAVWRIDHENILKLQYANAFRPPTFYELENPGQGNIEPSQIRTLEVGYILRKPTWQGRASVFQSDLNDPITFDEINSAGFINDQNARLRGVELEYQRRLSSSMKLDANLSYVDATFKDTGNTLPGGANWLGNLGLIWRPLAYWTTTLQLRYVGERSRATLDSRAALSPCTALDLTVGYARPAPGVRLTFGIKNLTDADIRYPQQLTADFNGDYFSPYPDDYPRPGRRWWLNIGYQF